jgi:aldehyde:ferredoxin oxidoreductase
MPTEILVQLLEAATGQVFSEDEFTQLGERIWNLERVFNAAEGFRRKDDQFPAREFEAIDGEDTDVPQFTREEADFMLDEYYEQRGWDNEGIPTSSHLAKIGLEEYTQRVG